MRMSVRTAYFILFFILQLIFVQLKKQKIDYMRMDGFKNCDHDTPNKIEDISITLYQRWKLLINGNIHVKKSAKGLPAVINIFRCPSRDYSDCEHYLRVKQNDFCPIFEVKGQFWSSFYDAVSPRFKCPIKENVTYKIRNATFDLELFLKMVSYVPNKNEYHWMFRTQVYSPKKEELLCVEGMGKLESIRA